jgi:hypothetical protein
MKLETTKGNIIRGMCKFKQEHSDGQSRGISMPLKKHYGGLYQDKSSTDYLENK